MDMPRPTDAHRRLEPLAGRWTGTETWHPSPISPEGSTAEGHVHNRLILGGFALVQDYEHVADGEVVLRGHGVFRFDASSGEVHLHWFDSSGAPPNLYRGGFDGDRLVLTEQQEQGWVRAVFDLSEPDRHVFGMEVSGDGE